MPTLLLSHRNPVSFLGDKNVRSLTTPETGFLLGKKQLTLAFTTETRFLFLRGKKRDRSPPQKPGFLLAKNS
ncbi:hypothetical protein [Planktothricoides sp. SR001]|uniref:hypothetical protein n=1 Tax=Planktothricoides sp. SR001 TaxID=1705388 RepID=UPI0012E2E203|nr:hypothetical protein [Planktothricoides sp. SR001]